MEAVEKCQAKDHGAHLTVHRRLAAPEKSVRGLQHQARATHGDERLPSLRLLGWSTDELTMPLKWYSDIFKPSI